MAGTQRTTCGRSSSSLRNLNALDLGLLACDMVLTDYDVGLIHIRQRIKSIIAYCMARKKTHVRCLVIQIPLASVDFQHMLFYGSF